MPVGGLNTGVMALPGPRTWGTLWVGSQLGCGKDTKDSKCPVILLALVSIVFHYSWALGNDLHHGQICEYHRAWLAIH